VDVRLFLHALCERIAARLETVGRACRAGRIDSLHRHRTAGEQKRRREGYPFHHLLLLF
jgi:hypothetical protein